MQIIQKNFKYLEIITAFFVAVLLVSNIASSKIMMLGPLSLDGGTILFPLSYIFGDVLTEVYGYKRSRKVIWIGFAMMMMASLIFWLIGILPPAPEWPNQEAYNQILGFVPRIFIASLIAYFAGEFSNSFLLAKMKIWMNGKHLWARTISSTLVGQAVDSLIFVVIAFAGLFENSFLVAIILSNYVFKVAIEIIFTPITYKIVAFLKKHEHEDYYDRKTNFNPFALKES